jgi:hypothetical protein
MSVSDTPTFKLLFDGLLVLAFNKNKNLCEFGVVNAPDHVLRIEVVKVDPNRGPIELPNISRYLPSKGNIRIDSPNSAKTHGVQFFNDLDRPFRRHIGKVADMVDDTVDAQDFRWLVDLEGEEFHNKKLDLKPGFPNQRIIVSGGLFYTHALIDVQLVRSDNSVSESPVASPIGCNLDLDVGEEFVLTYGPDDENIVQKIILTAEKGVTYIIQILNNPKNDQHAEHNGGSQPEDLSTHFHFYYDEAVEVNGDKKFDILSPQEGGEGLGPNRPCGGAGLSLHTDGLTD